MAAAKFTGSMRLLIDSESNLVLFAEARKETVDFLFHMLSLPIATVITLIKQHDQMVGSIENLYTSIENLHESYILPDHSRQSLLKPITKPCACSVPTLQLNGVAAYEKKFYKCEKCKQNGNGYSSITRVTDDPNADCPGCSGKMCSQITYVEPPVAVEKVGGFVKEAVTYMVTDNLDVSPMSTVSCISLLNRFNVKGVNALQEMTVDFGYDQASLALCTSLSAP